jgi:hypothetical protein
VGKTYTVAYKGVLSSAQHLERWIVHTAFSILHKDLGIPTIREEIKNSSKKYKDRLQTHANDLATNLFDAEGEVRRLKKFKPSDLSTRFD